MSDLGQLLRKARMEKKISLEDLQETTKIRKRYLEAIEEGNYKILPGNFYVRAFIKSYAEAVGLDPNEVLRLYQNVIPSPEPEHHIEPMRTKRTSRNTERIGKWASNVMMISFVVLILGIIYYYLNMNYAGGASNDATSQQSNKLTEKSEPSAPAPAASGGAAANAPAEKKPDSVPVPPPPPPPKTEVKLVKSERGTDYYTVSDAKQLNIEMKVTGDACWIQLDSLGEKREMVEQGTYVNGKSKSWEMNNAAFMTFGKANAVELTINGVPVVVGDAPNVKKLQIEFAQL